MNITVYNSHSHSHLSAAFTVLRAMNPARLFIVEQDTNTYPGQSKSFEISFANGCGECCIVIDYGDSTSTDFYR